MADWLQRIRERAYEIWEGAGRPHGQHDEHWFQAEREINDSNGGNREDFQSAREYNRDLQRFEKSGEGNAKAQEAKRAVEGPERESLKRAEQEGKQRSKGDDTTSLKP